METQITFVITLRDGDILYRTEDARQYVVKYEDICQRKLETIKVAQLTDLSIKYSIGPFSKKDRAEKKLRNEPGACKGAIELRFHTDWHMYVIGEKLREEGFPVR